MDRKPNTNQRDAIAMILDPSPTPPILVIGPFGTGKTFTLNLACVSILSQFEASNILICTHSNSAANIHLEHLDRKMQKNPSLDIRPLRVLSVNRIVEDVPKTLRKYCLIEGILRSISNIFFVETFKCRSEQWRSQIDIWSSKCNFSCIYRRYKESISEEMNNSNDLNLHSITKWTIGIMA